MTKIKNLRHKISNMILEMAGSPGWENIIDEIPVGNCELDGSDDEVGGEHSFHGNRMYPCGGSKFDMNVGKGGPFIGHGGVESKDLDNARAYLQKWKPSSLVAYSRGGAVAQQVSDALPGDVTYLAPAWGRTYGQGMDVAGSGKIYHGGADRFVPLKNSCTAAQGSGMSLHIKPDRGHGSILKDKKGGQLGSYKQLSADDLQKCVDEIPDWGAEDYPGRDDDRVSRQNQWVKDWYTQEENLEESRQLRQYIRKTLLESIPVDVEVGDIILTGKFKNKRQVVKKIGKDQYGQPTINGKTILKFKIEKHLPKEKWSAKTREELEDDDE